MTIFDSTPYDKPQQETVTPTFGEWLRSTLVDKNISVAQLSEITGISQPGIYNITNGKTTSPRQETRDKISRALDEHVPDAVEAEIVQESKVSGYEWSDFTPSDLQTVPETGGVYVFYDITDRPVYVGKSRKNIRYRVKDHQTRFWFKHPLVVKGAFLAVPDPDMCDKIESILIKFLGNHALLNVKGVTRDMDEA